MTNAYPDPPKRRCRIPLFHAVPGKARADGWTPLKQAEFIGELAETRSVTEAARRVGMSRETAYRLRRRRWSASFCAAWDAAMGRPPIAFKPAFDGAGLRAAHLRRLGLPAVAMELPSEQAKARGTPAPAKVTLAELRWRVESGQWRVLLERGKYVGVQKKGDDSALLELAARLGIASRRGAQAGEEGQRSQV